MKVQALIHTGVPGRMIAPGDILNFETEMANEWIKAGWARIPRKGPRREPIRPIKAEPVKPAEEINDGAGGGS